MSVCIAYTAKVPKPAHIAKYTRATEERSGDFSNVTVYSTQIKDGKDVTTIAGTVRYGLLSGHRRLQDAASLRATGFQLEVFITAESAKYLLEWLTQTPWTDLYVKTEMTSPLPEVDGVQILVDLLEAAQVNYIPELEEEVIDIFNVQVAGSIKSPYLLYLASRRVRSANSSIGANLTAHADAMLRKEPAPIALMPTGLVTQQLGYGK